MSIKRPQVVALLILFSALIAAPFAAAVEPTVVEVKTTADVTPLVKQVTDHSDEGDAALLEEISLNAKEIETLIKAIRELRVEIASLKPTETKPSIDAPGEYPVPGLLTVTVRNAEWASAWTSYDGQTIPARRVPPDGVLVFEVKAAGRIVISANPSPDGVGQVDRRVDLVASGDGPDLPPVGGAILVKPTDSLADIFRDLPEGQTVSLPMGATFDEILPVPPNGTTVNVYGQGARPIVRGFDSDRGSRTGVTFEGIHFKTQPGNDDRVFRLLGSWTDLKIIDSVAEGGTHGYTIQGESADRRHVRPLIEGCIVKGQHVDSKWEAKGIGIFAKNTEGLIIRETVGADIAYVHPRTTYSQFLYIEDNTEGTLIDRCVGIRIGAAGFQLRSGGVARDSIFIRQSIHSWITGPDSAIERCLSIYPEDLTENPINGFLPRGGGFQANEGSEGSRLTDNQVYHDRGTNLNHGAYKFDVSASKIKVSGNLAGDFTPIADQWGTPLNLDGIREVTPPDVSGLEAWAESLASRPYGEPFPDVAKVIADFYAEAVE